jgi:hypothetical protein
MKYYIVEPTYKKSLVEKTIFSRKNEEGKTIFLERELGWRWGSFFFTVPDTEEEAIADIKEQGYDSVLDWAYDHGYTMTDDNGDEILDPDSSIVDLLTTTLLPEESDDFVDITEDYGNAEMIECDDGCWEYWNVRSFQVELSEEEQEELVEGVEEAYNEEWEEGVEALGWEFVDTLFELHCSPKITPCDATGTPLSIGEQNE